MDMEVMKMGTTFVETFRESREAERWQQGRSWIYQLLIDMLGQPPSVSIIAQWQHHVMKRGDVILTDGGEELKQNLSGIKQGQFLRRCEEEMNEYRRLFDCERAIFPYPCEGAYRAIAGKAPRISSQLIRNQYSQSGIVFNKINQEQDDHIVLELEFMAILIERSMDERATERAIKELLDAQIEFLENHLLQWAPQFGDSLAEMARTPLYMLLGKILAEFIPYDLAMLRDWREG